MTVMNATVKSVTQSLGQRDVLAIRNALLAYSADEQASLLSKMPVDDAALVMQEMSLRHVQRLLTALDDQGKQTSFKALSQALGVAVGKHEEELLQTNHPEVNKPKAKRRWAWLKASALGLVTATLAGVAYYYQPLSQWLAHLTA